MIYTRYSRCGDDPEGGACLKYTGHEVLATNLAEVFIDNG